jgi:hypothetical protein
MGRDPLDLADIEARADYVHDEADRLVAVNDIGNPPAPWVLVVRTAVGSIVRFRQDAPPPLVAEATELASRLAPLDLESEGADGSLEALEAVVERHVPITRRWSGPAFTFPISLFPSIGAAQLYPANAALLHPALVSWGPELAARRPAFGVFRGGQAVAICASARLSPLAAEAGVETAPGFRGQGAAGLAVMAWAAAVREGGRIPLYSTSWENGASRAVAGKLELELFAEDLWVG